MTDHLIRRVRDPRIYIWASQMALVEKNLHANAGDMTCNMHARLMHAWLHYYNLHYSLVIFIWVYVTNHLICLVQKLYLDCFRSAVTKKRQTCNMQLPTSSIWSGRSPGEGHGNPLQYSCLENLMGKGAWWATVHKVTKSRTRLKRLSRHAGCAYTEKRPWGDIARKWASASCSDKP